MPRALHALSHHEAHGVTDHCSHGVAEVPLKDDSSCALLVRDQVHCELAQSSPFGPMALSSKFSISSL
eukprot:3623598-Heterocapsa_arctica.AAC.1